MDDMQIKIINDLAKTKYINYYMNKQVIISSDNMDKLLEETYKAGHQQGVKDENSACGDVCGMMNKQPMPEDATSSISTLAAYVQCEEAIRRRIK